MFIRQQFVKLHGHIYCDFRRIYFTHFRNVDWSKPAGFFIIKNVYAQSINIKIMYHTVLVDVTTLIT